MILTLPLHPVPIWCGVHSPVLLPVVVAGLEVKSGEKYIDATLGGGGYAIEILKRGGVVLGIDADQEAIDYVKRRLEVGSGKWEVGKEVFLEQGNFADLTKVARKHGFEKVAGIIFDLGISTYQLKYSGRGFSFEVDEPLDMRMNKKGKLTARDIINRFSEEELYEIFTKFAEELHSRTIATAILRTRSLKGPILTTRRLVEIIEQASRGEKDQKRRKARIFQALRIVVNNELENLKEGLGQAIEMLAARGRLLVLSYHSLEDRLVKIRLNDDEKKGILRITTKDPIRPDRRELKINPSARSAKLRIAEKI